MRRRLSTRSTLFFKVILPTLWIGGFASFTLWCFVAPPEALQDANGRGPLPEWAKWLLLCFTIGGTVWGYLWGIRLKTVELDEKSLHVSNFLREVGITLTEVSRVEENVWLNTHPITIHFNQATTFGASVLFMPRTSWLGGSHTPHSIAEELRSAVETATALASVSGEFDDHFTFAPNQTEDDPGIVEDRRKDYTR
jgi:hypothetical protein